MGFFIYIKKTIDLIVMGSHGISIEEILLDQTQKVVRYPKFSSGY
jgi:nucleotide-binding universal stress UspA family protein